MKRTWIVGAFLVGGSLTCLSFALRPAEAQEGAVGRTRNAPPPPAHSPTPAFALPSAEYSVPRAVAEKAESIDSLLDTLDAIKAKKAELDQAEKQAVSKLKEKLKEQKDRMQRLGIVDEPKTYHAAPVKWGEQESR